MRENMLVVNCDDEKKELYAEFNDVSVIDILNIISMLATNIRERNQDEEDETVEKMIKAAADGKKFLVTEEGDLAIG